MIIDKDFYGPTELIITHHTPEEASEYLTLKDLGFEEKDVLYIDKIDSNFEKATEHFMEADLVGIDCEFSFTMIKSEETLVSTV